MEGRVERDLLKDFSPVSGGGDARWIRFHQGSRVGLAVVVVVVVVVEAVVVVEEEDFLGLEEDLEEEVGFFLVLPPLPFLLAMLLHHFLCV